MKKAGSFLILMLTIFVAKAHATPAAGGVEAVQALRIMVESGGSIKTSAQLATRIGANGAPVAQVIFAKLGNNLGNLYSRLGNDIDWANLEKIAAENAYSAETVTNAVSASLSRGSGRIQADTLVMAFAAELERPTAELASNSAAGVVVSDEEVDAFAANFVPTTPAAEAIVAAGESGTVEGERLFVRAMTTAALFAKTSAKVCGLSCSAQAVKDLAQQGVRGALSAYHGFGLRTSDEFLGDVARMTGDFAGSVLPAMQFRIGTEAAGKQALEGSIDRGLEMCMTGAQ